MRYVKEKEETGGSSGGRQVTEASSSATVSNDAPPGNPNSIAPRPHTWDLTPGNESDLTLLAPVPELTHPDADNVVSEPVYIRCRFHVPFILNIHLSSLWIKFVSYVLESWVDIIVAGFGQLVDFIFCYILLLNLRSLIYKIFSFLLIIARVEKLTRYILFNIVPDFGKFIDWNCCAFSYLTKFVSLNMPLSKDKLSWPSLMCFEPSVQSVRQQAPPHNHFPIFLLCAGLSVWTVKQHN